VSDERPVIQAAHNTPEQVALTLFHIIARVEGKSLDWNGADREWILDTYAECIRTIRQPQTRGTLPGVPHISVSRHG
jgi:hypothetical protein